MNRMSTSQTVTDLGKTMVIEPDKVLVGRLRQDGQVDGRTGLRPSKYHTQQLHKLGARKLLTRAAREGYQVEIRR